MFDLHHYYGAGLQWSASGDLLVADLSTTGEQRTYRRLLTNPELQDASGAVIASPDYTFSNNYGAGLGRRVGSPGDVDEITAAIKSQMQLESAVSQTPVVPDVQLIESGEVIGAVVRYNDSRTGDPIILDFQIGK